MQHPIKNDRHQIIKILGQGGSADVFLARHLGLDSLRVLKIMNEDFMGEEKRKKRFKQEARLASRLSHPGIVDVYDVGEIDGKLVIEMEYVKGKSLRQHLEDHGSFPPPVATAILYSILDALHFAHEAKIELDGKTYVGVIHRDLKPENVLLRRDGRTALCDFGVAKLGADLLTQTQNISGSVAYMAPERLKGQTSTRAIDIFALGIIFFEMLKGYRPFAGNESTTIIQNVSNWRIADLDAELEGYDPVIVEIIDKCLQRDPIDRFGSANELRKALTPLYKSWYGDSPPEINIREFLSLGRFSTSEFKALVTQDVSKKTRFWAAGSIAALLALAGGWVAFHYEPSPNVTIENPTEIPQMVHDLLDQKNYQEAIELISMANEKDLVNICFQAGKELARHENMLPQALTVINRGINQKYHPSLGALRAEIYLKMNFLNLAEEELHRVSPWLSYLDSEQKNQYFWMTARVHYQKSLSDSATQRRKLAREALKELFEQPGYKSAPYLVEARNLWDQLN